MLERRDPVSPAAGRRQVSVPAYSLGQFWKDNCGEAVYVILWFTFSIIFSLYNKEVLGEKKMKFPCPLLLTSTNFVWQWAAAAVFVRCQTRVGDVVQRAIPPLELSTYVKKVIPCALGLGLDIGLSNLAMVHVTVSFYTMVKATAPVFALGFGIMFGLEEPEAKVFGSVSLVVAGLFLSTNGAAEFKLGGFILVLSATAISGFRWNLLQILVQGETSLPTPMHVLEVVAPVAGVLLLVLALFIERPWDGSLNPFLDSISGWGEIFLLVFFGGFLAIGLSLSSLMVLQRTSVLMFMAFGALKEVLTVFFSVMIYGDVLTVKSLFGLLLVLIGVVLYKYHRYTKRHGAGGAGDTGSAEDQGGPLRSEMVSLISMTLGGKGGDEDEEEAKSFDPERDDIFVNACADSSEIEKHGMDDAALDGSDQG